MVAKRKHEITRHNIFFNFASVNYVLFVTDAESLAPLWSYGAAEKVWAFNAPPPSEQIADVPTLVYGVKHNAAVWGGGYDPVVFRSNDTLIRQI